MGGGIDVAIRSRLKERIDLFSSIENSGNITAFRSGPDVRS